MYTNQHCYISFLNEAIIMLVDYCYMYLALTQQFNVK